MQRGDLTKCFAPNAMVNPFFTLSHNKPGQWARIRLRVNYDGNRFSYKLAKEILPELWPYVNGQPKDKMLTAIIRERNLDPYYCTLLSQFLVTVKTTVVQFLGLDYRGISKERLRAHLDLHFNPLVQKNEDETQPKAVETAAASVALPVLEEKEPESKEPAVLDYIDKFIEGATNGTILTKRKKKYEKQSLKNFKIFRDKMAGFNEEVYPVTWKGFNNQFSDDLAIWMQSQDYHQNYIYSMFARLKMIMKRAASDGIKSVNVANTEYFGTPFITADSIYNTQAELDKLFEHDFGDKVTLGKARDLYLIGCYTALRVSDYSRLSLNHLTELEGEMVFGIYPVKGKNNKVYIPAHPVVLKILEKYEGRAPSISEQDLNKFIKLAAAHIGIDNDETVLEFVGGVEKEFTYKRYELISSHTARRTGATLMYLAGLPIKSIMFITGHKTETNFMKYIRVTKEQEAIRMARSAFFRPRAALLELTGYAA